MAFDHELVDVSRLDRIQRLEPETIGEERVDAAPGAPVDDRLSADGADVDDQLEFRN